MESTMSAVNVADAKGQYEIRPPASAEEFAQLARVFQAVFRLSDAATPPGWLMEDSTKAGGLTLGMWLGEEAVGVSYALAGRADGEPCLFSDGLGVLAEHRGKGRAIDLKLAQRDAALAIGYKRIKWTFSALRAVNAHLYLSRLGGRSRSYVVDYRGGHTTDWQTEGDIPLDEFVVEWDLESERVRSRLAEGGPPADATELPTLISQCEGEGLKRRLLGTRKVGDLERLAVEVPPDFQALVDEMPSLAHDWRDQTRPIFVDLERHGFALVECTQDPDSSRTYYIFDRDASDRA